MSAGPADLSDDDFQFTYWPAIGMAATAALIRMSHGRSQDEAVTDVLAALTPERINEAIRFIRDQREQENLEEMVYGPDGAAEFRKKRDREFQREIERQIREEE